VVEYHLQWLIVISRINHRGAYDVYREKTERSIKKDPKTVIRYVDFKKRESAARLL
jgi:hypothetical protein